MRTPQTHTANYMIIGREPEKGADAPLRTMGFDSLDQVASYARRVHAANRVAEEAVLRTQIRLGVMLLQIRPQIRHGQWRAWLANAKIHYRTAHRCCMMAFRLADSKGELDTARLQQLMTEYEIRENVGNSGEADFAVQIGEEPQVSAHKVQRAMGMRKAHNPCCALPPFEEEDRDAVARSRYLPLAIEAHRPPVVIDGRMVQPAMTVEEIRERSMRTAAVPAAPTGSNVTNGHNSKPRIGAIGKALEVMRRLISNFENSLWSANDAVAEAIYSDLRALEDRFRKLVTS